MSTFMMWNRIDGNNATEFEKKIRDSFKNEIPDELVLDASNLEYISSGGLRVILRLRKEIKNVTMVNVNSMVFEILEVTGFNEILGVERPRRRISIEGCKIIGSGANGTVYRIAPDEIVKVLKPGVSLEKAERERELAKWALIKGVPTAIPNEIAEVGDQYGMIFELLSAKASEEYVEESPENLEDFIDKSYSLMKELHTIEVKPGELPDIKEKYVKYAGSCRDLFTEEEFEKIEKLFDDIPESKTLLHGDYHVKNIMICDGELMLIDMDSLSCGDSIFEMVGIYSAYIEFSKFSAKSAAFLGISQKSCRRIWERMLELYSGGADEETRMAIERKVRTLGCLWIIDFMRKRPERESAAHSIEVSVNDVKNDLKQM